MDRYFEVKNLIEDYLELTHKDSIKGNDLHDCLIIDLTNYYEKLQRTLNIDEDYFLKIIKNEDNRLELFKYLDSINSNLLAKFVRLWNIHQRNGANQINNSDFHFRYLSENSIEPLARLGFTIKEKQDQKIKFISASKIIISVVYQRYDPPEVWINRENDKSSIPLGTYTEKYFNKDFKLIHKYAGFDANYFDYSSFDYYYEFLFDHLTELIKMGDFVSKINDWWKNNNKD